MRAVRDLRKWARVVLVVLLVLDVAAVAALLTPLAGGRANKIKQDEAARQQWQDERQRALPVRDIEKKIDEARGQVATFYDSRFPNRISAVAIELGKLSGDNNVKLANVHYLADDEIVEGLRRVQMDASLSGDYVKVVKFINALERDKMFFLVTGVALGERSGGAITLTIHIETYLRETEPAQTQTSANVSG